ncbi:MAG TPA: tetratricopeptide repeat protein [Gammaproteobacteria bacterium]|nr:tetratricopeptide repeat protein [Gammaproteobacteria bacterium]
MRSPRPAGDLLSGTALFGEPVTEPAVSLDDVFALDADMRAFVEQRVADAGSMPNKLRRLLEGMQTAGLFSLDYSVAATRTVAETFHDRVGNCLSFTMLFVALARAAGVDARYQMVDVPPSWSAESGFVVLTNHINARVRGRGQPDYVVDFNQEEFKSHYVTHGVSDRYAAALFYNNKGVEALLDEDYRASFVNFRAAIETYPDLAAAWVNLGLLYSKRGRPEQAEAAYQKALDLDDDNQTAMTNLAALYTRAGDAERAELYRQRIRRHQQQNPYYHFFLARAAFEQKHFAEALELVDKALKLKRDEQFYLLQGQAFDRLGESRNAASSFARARQVALKDGRAVY